MGMVWPMGMVPIFQACLLFAGKMGYLTCLSHKNALFDLLLSRNYGRDKHSSLFVPY